MAASERLSSLFNRLADRAAADLGITPPDDSALVHPALPIEMLGCDENRARLKRMVHILSQSKTGRILLTEAQNPKCRLHTEGVMTTIMSAGGFINPLSRLVVINPIYSDEMGASVIAHELTHALQGARGVAAFDSKLHPLAVIQRDIVMDADARAMALQVAWELKDVAPRVWQAVARMDKSMTVPFMAAIKADPEAANDGRAATASFMGFLEKSRYRLVYEKGAIARLGGTLAMAHAGYNGPIEKAPPPTMEDLPFLMDKPENWPAFDAPADFFSVQTDWAGLKASLGINELLTPASRHILTLDGPELRGVDETTHKTIVSIGQKFKKEDWSGIPIHNSPKIKDMSLVDYGRYLARRAIAWTRLAKHVATTPVKRIAENLTIIAEKKQSAVPQPPVPAPAPHPLRPQA